jgi:hypothetical protein
LPLRSSSSRPLSDQDAKRPYLKITAWLAAAYSLGLVRRVFPLRRAETTHLCDSFKFAQFSSQRAHSQREERQEKNEVHADMGTG